MEPKEAEDDKDRRMVGLGQQKGERATTWFRRFINTWVDNGNHTLTKDQKYYYY